METTALDTILKAREFIDGLQEGVWIADEHGAIVAANRALATLVGSDAADALVGKPWRDLFPPDQAGRLAKAASRDDVQTLSDSAVRGPGDTAIPASVTLARKQGRGTTWYFGSVVSTQQPGSGLGLSEMASRQVMENAVDGICIVDDRRIVYVNRRFEELTGYARKQLAHMALDKLLVAQDRDRIAQILDEPARVLTPVHHEVGLLTRSGLSTDCELRIVPTASNAHTVLLCFLRDISQLRRAERAQTDFIAMVSHELRTPLATIKEAMSLLSETAGPQFQDRQRRYLVIAQEEMNRLNRMITNLVEASRMESGKTALKLEPVDLADVIEQSLESMTLFINRKSLRVGKHLPDNLPPVLADRDRLVQVVNNLLDNAIKYTPTGNTIAVSARVLDKDSTLLSETGVLADTDYVQVDITDTGPGIPAEFIERVFGKFERVDPHGPGIGLGLAIVDSIIRMHYGKVWARSTLGEGTTLSFILPVGNGT